LTGQGSCPCGAVGFVIVGPVRAVIVCHCDACHEATGGPWPAAAAYRRDLAVADEAALIWEPAPVSEHGASRGRCRSCGTVVFWDAPGRATVSFAAALFDGGEELAVAAHIWVPEGQRVVLAATGIPVEPQGLPASVRVGWRDDEAAGA
jgi:hypothetical protein